MKATDCGLLLLALMLASGCQTSVRLPLCPKLAEASYGVSGTKPVLVGRFVQEAAAAKKIRIVPLSPFVAEFTGRKRDLEWLRANYPALVCAFDTRAVNDDRSTHLSSMSHVRDWMRLVASCKDDNLMLAEYKYCENCCAE